MDATQETWLPVVGWEGIYDVSDLGRIRSLPRWTPSRWGQRLYPSKPIIRKQRPDDDYWQVTLCDAGKRVRVYAHRLVLEAFVGPCPEGMEGCHWDGDRRNNALSNLRWDTHEANIVDAVRVGTRRGKDEIHCASGHPLSGDNLYITPATGTRMCRECRLISQRSLRPAWTHCSVGHEMTDANTYLNPAGTLMRCRKCLRDKRGVTNPRGPYGPRRKD